jgi:hypothetical protein
VTRQSEGANVMYSVEDESIIRLLDDVVASVADHLRELSALATGVPDVRVTESAEQSAEPRQAQLDG